MSVRATGYVYSLVSCGAALALLAGCTSDGTSPWNDPDILGPTSEEFVWTDSQRASILFAIDSAVGTCALHETFVRGIPAFFEGLRSRSGSRELIFNVAVIGSDLESGDLGALAGWPNEALGGCSVADVGCDELPAPMPSVITEETFASERVLSCLAEVGDAGGGDPFLAAAVALSPARLEESGLLLEDSLLAIIVISDDEGACEPESGTAVLDCVGTSSSSGASTLVRVVEELSGVADFYLARIPSSSEIVSTDPDGPILDPGGGGTSPVCSIPGLGSPGCEAGLGNELYTIGRDIASAAVPECLDVAPCPGVGTEDIEVELETTDGTVLAPFEDYFLVPDPFCAGGYRIDFAEDPYPGEMVNIVYPGGSPASCSGS